MEAAGLNIGNICHGAVPEVFDKAVMEIFKTCALFEADGGAWKIAAMQNIAFWLKDKVPTDLPIAF